MKKIIAFMIAFLTINTFADVTVNSSGNGATCSNNSSATYLNVTCTPKRDDCTLSSALLFDNNSEGAPVKTWSGSGYGVGATYTYALNSNHNYQLNVSSSCKNYSVSSSTEGNGSLSFNPPYAEYGTTIKVTISPKDGYELASITSSDVSLSGSGNTRSFTMPKKDVTVKATFKAKSYTIKTSSVANGSLTVSPSSSASTDSKVTLTPSNTKEGYELDYVWYCKAASSTACSDTKTKVAASSGKYTFTMPAYNVLVGAEFKAIKYTIVKNVQPSAGGSLSASSTGTYGATISFSLSKNSGYKVKSVVVNRNSGDTILHSCNADYSSCSFTMPNESVKITANFEKLYKVELVETDKGTVSLSNSGTVLSAEKSAGDSVDVYVKSYIGYSISAVSIKAGNADVDYLKVDDYRYRFKMPTSDVKVSLICVDAQYALFLKALDNGKIEIENIKSEIGSVEGNAYKGDSVFFTVTPNPGFEVDSAFCDKASSELNHTVLLEKVGKNKYVFVMPTSSVVISATFMPVEYAIRTEGHATIRTFGAMNGAFAEISTATHLSDGGTQNAVMIGAKANEGYEITGMSAVELTTGTPIAEADLSLERLTEEDLLDTLKKGTEMLGAAFEADRAFAIAMPADSVLITIETKAIAYDITVASMENGSVEVVSGAKDSVGEEVSLKAVPSVGYEIDFLKVVRTDTEKEIATSKNGSEYSFVMPASDVLVSAGFKAIAVSSSSEEDPTSSEVASSSSARSSSSVVSSSSSKNVFASSSSAKQSSSSSAKVASSSSAKAKSSSSSTKAKSSSSKNVIASSSSAKQSSSSFAKVASSSSVKAKSSSSKGKDAIVAMAQLPQFSVTAVARDVQIVGAKVGAPFAILDMQGRVMTSGRVESANFNLAIARAGTFMIRIADQVQVVTLR